LNSIKLIELQNFQSHVKTIIEPAGPGFLTVITGPSDSGKTAIIRALKWLLYNQPQGAEFTRTGASMVRVAVDYVGGVTVVRERTASTNRYKILQPGTEKPQVFEGFGASVPLEVQEITGVRPIKIADQELLLNLSEQLDPPFLGQKSTTAPGRAKILGKLAGTEEIDVAGASVGKDLYRRGQDEKRLAAEIEELAARIEEFAWIEELGEKIAALENLAARIKEQRELLVTLEEKRSELLRIQAEMNATQKVLKRWTVLPAIEAAVKEAEVAAVRCKTLKTLGVKLTDIQYGIEEAQEMIYRLRGLEAAEKVVQQTAQKFDRAKQLHRLDVKLGQVDSDMNLCRTELKKPRVIHVERIAAITEKIATQINRLETIGHDSKVLRILDSNREKAISIIQDYEKRIPELQREYKAALIQAGICPTCGQQIQETCLKEVI
jgi:exonuclease SbcC